MPRKPLTIFLALCLVGGAGLATYLLLTQKRLRERASTSPAEASAPQAPEPAPDSSPANHPPEAAAQPVAADSAPTSVDVTVKPVAPAAPRRVFFRYNGTDGHYGAVAWVDAATPRQVHFAEKLRCEVVYAAGGSGICLTADRGVFTTYSASLFDARTFAIRSTFSLNGIPSRARVSVDGKIAAFTVFVSGHGYTTLDFSTQTLLIDVATGKPLADLENFVVSRGGEAFKAADFNFWGVTFTREAKNFYATLSTGGQHYLIRGDISARTAAVIHENVECPSLSPDGRHIAYKKRFTDDNRIVWQLHVLDVGTGRETALAEKRSIDDQLEWLDDAHVLYSVPAKDDNSSPSTDVWMVAIDGKKVPTPFVRNAYSPAAVRCASAAACAAAPGS